MKISIAEAHGYRIASPNSGWMTITHVNPYARCLIWEGVTIPSHGPVAGRLGWDELKAKHDLEIVPTPEEAAMVERGRLTHQVAAQARTLAESIDAWLSNEKRR